MNGCFSEKEKKEKKCGRRKLPMYGAITPPTRAQTEAEPRPTFLITVGNTSTAYTNTCTNTNTNKNTSIANENTSIANTYTSTA